MNRMLYYILISASILNISYGQKDNLKAVECTDSKYRIFWEAGLKKYPLTKNATKLSYELSFPEDKMADQNIYLWMPTDITIDNNGRIFILDQKWREVFQFDRYGTYIRRIGKKGPGPGELSIPICICVADNYIYIIDNGNRNIQKYSLDGKYIHGQKIFKSYFRMASDLVGNIYAAPMRSTPDQHLVDVFDSNCEYVKSILKPNDTLMAMPSALTNMTLIDINNRQEIFIGFLYYPLVIKYDIKKDTIKEINIENKIIDEEKKSNLNNVSKKIPLMVPIIEGIQASERGGFYILHGYPRTEIYEYDDNDKYINDYWHIKACNYRARDFVINEKERNAYFMQRIPEFKIDIFRLENIGHK